MTEILDAKVNTDATAVGRFFVPDSLLDLESVQPVQSAAIERPSPEEIARAAHELASLFPKDPEKRAEASYSKGLTDIIRQDPSTPDAQFYIRVQRLTELANRRIDTPH